MKKQVAMDNVTLRYRWHSSARISALRSMLYAGWPHVLAGLLVLPLLLVLAGCVGDTTLDVRYKPTVKQRGGQLQLCVTDERAPDERVYWKNDAPGVSAQAIEGSASGVGRLGRASRDIVEEGFQIGLREAGYKITQDSPAIFRARIEKFGAVEHTGKWSLHRSGVISIGFEISVYRGSDLVFRKQVVHESKFRSAFFMAAGLSQWKDNEQWMSGALTEAVRITLGDAKIVAAIEDSQAVGVQVTGHDTGVRVNNVSSTNAPLTSSSQHGEHTIPNGVEAMWAISIGISDYQHEGVGGLGQLQFADNDAQEFAKALKVQGWNSDHIRLLLNREATKKNVEYALETWLRRAGKDDMVVLFWSSHGWPDLEDPERAYFACYDSRPSDPSSGFRMDKVRMALEERGVRNVVVIADTCHSGKIIRANDPKGIGIVPALEAMQKRQQIPKGWVFVASADPDRKAYEDKAWSNGALTHVLLEGMQGKADGYQSAGLKDGLVTMGELRTYVTERMAEESLNVLGARLLPLFYTTSGDPEIWNLTLKSD